MDIAILTEDLYEDTELWYPYYRLREAGFETQLVAPRPGTYRSKAGYPA
ncbi:MAG: protease, partial [Gammaproteobacteria bacterium]